MGVATSLDTHIEQLMEQHGWADGGGGRGADHAGRRAGVDSAALGSGTAEASLFELPGFDAGEYSGVRAKGACSWRRPGACHWDYGACPSGRWSAPGSHESRAREADTHAVAAGHGAGLLSGMC